MRQQKKPPPMSKNTLPAHCRHILLFHKIQTNYLCTLPKTNWDNTIAIFTRIWYT